MNISQNKISTFGVLLIIFLITWAGSGTRSEFYIIIFIISLLVFLISACSYRKTINIENYLPLWFGIAISLIGIVQYFNNFGTFVQVQDFGYIEKCDYIKYLPTSIKNDFSQGNALSAAGKYLSLSLIFTIVYCLKNTEEKLLLTMIFFVANTFAMSIFAVLQKYANIHLMYGMFYSDSEIYGSFFLSNACGMFLMMAESVSLSLVVYYKNKGKPMFVTLYAFISIFLYFSILYSESIGAILASTILLCLFFFILLFSKYSFERLLLVILLTIPIITVLLAYFMPNSIIDSIVHSVSSRIEIYRSSLCSSSINLISGVGGDSYNNTIAIDLLNNQISNNAKNLLIPHHVHCDPLHYFLEYGLFGIIIVIPLLIFLKKEFYNYKKYMSKENYILLAGSIICILFSFGDMHLSIPSTMYAFAFLLQWSIYFNSKDKSI